MVIYSVCSSSHFLPPCCVGGVRRLLREIVFVDRRSEFTGQYATFPFVDCRPFSLGRNWSNRVGGDYRHSEPLTWRRWLRLVASIFPHCELLSWGESRANFRLRVAAKEYRWRLEVNSISLSWDILLRTGIQFRFFSVSLSPFLPSVFFSYLFVHFEQNVFIYHPVSFLRSLVIHRTWIAMLVCATRAMFSSLVLTNMGCWIGKAIDYAQKCITRLHVVWMEEDGVRVCITTQRGA